MSEQTARALIQGRGVPLPGDDVDTDRIIPARYLKSISFEELGDFAFQDERFDGEGKPKPHPFNDPRFAGGSILLVNRNFGCGSSREHAPQSLMRWGIRALIGESFAEIFSGNCTALGIPAVRVAHGDVERLMERAGREPDMEIVVDLEAKAVRVERGGGAAERFPLEMPEGDRQSLISGSWDTTSVLLGNLEAIRRTAARLPYVGDFAAGPEGAA
ncbi:MAG: 3-isopropylmalate dehydratase small subunit [Spirochaetales bacterium]|nr:3-isopropylmalate dehydratase small subunit [Spirochaetales bacterium]